MGRICKICFLVLALAHCPIFTGESSSGALFQEEWRWIRYTNNAGLPAHRISGVISASDSTLWAMADNGVAWFDSFRWQTLPDADNLLRNISAMVPDLHDAVLLVADKNLYQVNRKGIRPLPIHYGGRPLAVTSAVPLDKGRYLVATADGLFERSEAGVLPFEADFDDAAIDPRGKLFRTQRGRILLTSHAKLALLQQDEQRWQRIAHHGVRWIKELHDGSMLMASSITVRPDLRGLWSWREGEALRHAALDANGAILAVDFADGSGTGMLIDNLGRVKVFDEAMNLRDESAVDGRIGIPLCMHYDYHDNLWIGSPSGLYLFKQASQRWTQVLEGRTALQQQVNSICLRRNGELWAGSGAGILIKHSDDKVEVIDNAAGYELKIITGLAEDRDENVWVSSGSDSIGLLCWKDSAWRAYNSSDGLALSRIHKIEIDRSGRLWLLGLADPADRHGLPGAYIYDGHEFAVWGQDSPIAGRLLYDFCEGPEGERWFGTDSGLHRWDANGWRSWTAADGLPTGRVFTVEVDEAGKPYFGFQHIGSGLATLDDDDVPRIFTVVDGLPDDGIADIVRDAEGRLWFSTINGLGLVHKGQFAALGTASGLAYPNIWPLWPAGDRLLVGTIGGGVHSLAFNELYHPAPILTISPPAISGHSAFVLWQPFAYDGEMASEQVPTRYRLDQSPWTHWNTTREAYLPELAPGGHVLTIQAKGLFGQVSAVASRVVLNIPLPWYRIPAVQILLTLWFGSLLIVGFIYWRRRRRSMEMLRDSEMRLTRVTENLDDIVFRCRIRPAIEFEFVNSAASVITGFQPEDFRRNPNLLMERLHPDDQQGLQKLMRGEADFAAALLLRLSRRDGKQIWTELRAVPIYDDKGSLIALEGIMRDVTARQTEKETREALISELKAKTAELESFTYTVSHDLKSPLITIRGFVGMLERDTEQGDRPRMQEDIQHIHKATVKMQRLLDDLLHLSRAGRVINEPLALSLDNLVRDASNLVSGRLAEGGIELRIETPLPQVRGDRSRLVQVLQNLIDNAAKFCGHREKPCIAIGAEDRKDDVLVYIRDNGIGIDPRFQEKIFGLFETLATDQPGTGIGLALVKRIVEVHGGAIWVVSEGQDRGSTFYFTLPKEKIVD